MPLTAFVESHPIVNTATWFPELIKQTARIDANLQEAALGSLITNASTYRDLLAQAAAQVSQQLDQTLTDLVEFSARTLGRLGVP